MDWKLLTDSEFEELALQYAQLIHPQYDWKPTGKTRDDNRDFFYMEQSDSIFEREGWGEAKYSSNIKAIMSKTKWDQTITSGKLARNVTHIIFVTNAQIPFSYIFRAECLKNPPFERFEYINNRILEKWLLDNPEIVPEKLKNSVSKINLQSQETKINFYILDFYSLNANLLKESKEILVGREYLAFVIIESSHNYNANINFYGNFEVKQRLSENSNHNTTLVQEGINCFQINLIITEVKNSNYSNKELCLSVTDISKKEVKIKKKKYCLKNMFIPKIINSNQLLCLEKVKDFVNSVRGDLNSKNQQLVIKGDKGVGKSYMLEMLLREGKLQRQSFLIQFSDDMAENARSICLLFLTINFGIEIKYNDYWNNICEYYSHTQVDEEFLAFTQLEKIYEATKKESSVES